MSDAPAWQRWVPDASAGVATLAVGIVELDAAAYVPSIPGALAMVAALALAVGLCRALPAAALASAWFVGTVQVATGTSALLVEALLAVTAFGCARWGRAVTVWLSGASIPLAAVIAVLWLDSELAYRALELTGVRMLAETAYSGGGDWRVPAGMLLLALLLAPWLAGLALRFLDRARTSRVSQVAAEAQRDQAEEIARLRDSQARLARDVHDVVGHSLAVILAQAESAQYLPDADTEALRRTMATIATSARTSLQDVRQVLSPSDGSTAPGGRHGDLDALVEGVRTSGHEVVSTEVGTPRPLPPELEVVAFRVLQEMLTNAIRHGRRDEPILVERHWEGELRLEVRNVIGDPNPDGAEETRPLAAVDPADLAAQGSAGHGLEGMRRRLESVGGRLDVRRRAEPGGATFTATAWVPLRSGR